MNIEWAIAQLDDFVKATAVAYVPSPPGSIGFHSCITATAHEVDGEFIMLEGSSARLKWMGGEGHSDTSMRAKLEQDGTLVPTPDGSAMRFTRNHVFASPSAAAAIVASRSANSRAEWLIRNTRRTYGQWETEGVEEAMKQEVSSE